MKTRTNTGRYAKIVAAAVALLLLGVMTSAALAEDSNPLSALGALTDSTPSGTMSTSSAPERSAEASTTSSEPTSATSTTTAAAAPATAPSAPTTQSVFAPTVSSDKGDYAPGELVALRGSNWHAGEAVHIYVNDDQGNSWSRDSDVLADENGEIVESFNLPNWFVASYSVVATGAASGTVTAAFTDANPQSVQIAPGSRTVVPGSSATYTVTVPIAGNDGDCTVDLSVSGLPAGATGTLGSPTLTGPKGSSPSTSLNVATSGTTPIGTTTFAVTAARQPNCQGNGTLTGTANLVVAKSVGAVTVGAQTGTLTAGIAGSATYSITVNRNGATGTAFTASLSANGIPSGATASFNPSNVSFASGDTSQTSTLTINTTSAAAGSTSFTVRATNSNVTGDFSDGNGNLAIGSACTAASVTTQPSNASITYGANAIFTVAGGGNPSPSVQWQVSTNGGSNWTNLSGETGTTLTIAKAGVSQSGNQYRALFTNTCGGTQTAPSNAATLTVAAKMITVTPDSGRSKQYGASDPTLTYSSSPALESGDGFNGALGRVAGENVGSYAITLGSLSAGPNYSLALAAVPARFDITAKPVTITPNSGQSKVYGSADPALAFTNDSGLTASTLTGALGRDRGEGVGSYAITLGTLAAGSNYSLNLSTTPVTFTISKKAASVTAADTSKVYGSDDPPLTTTDEGFLPADLGPVKITFSASRAAGESVAGSPYTITPAASDGASSLLGNYDVTYNTGKLTITKKAASVTAADTSKVYGSDDPALTTTDSGFLAADLGAGKITFSASRAAGDSVAGSPYTITPSASDGATALLGNYDVTYNSGKLTITKKPITVSADDKTKVYGSADPALTVSVPAGAPALETGDSLSGNLERAAGKDVGSYAITKGTLTAGGNYDLTVTPGTFTITKKAITVTADDKTKVCGSADPALTVTVPAGALETGDSLSGSLVREPGNNVGSYAITKGSLTAGGNYDLTVTPGVFTISKKPITMSADDKTKVYGSADPALTITTPAGALESGDSLSGELTRVPGKDVGSYAITKGTLTASGNYELTVIPGRLTITKKPITVTADDKTKVVGAVDPALTYKVTSGSLESGDGVTGTLTRAPGEVVGTYAITQGTVTAGGNYDLTFVGATLKIVYGWDGFLQPINDTAHQTGLNQSKFKLGQTIPAKFVLKDASGRVVQQTTNPTFSRTQIRNTCAVDATLDTISDAVVADGGATYGWDGSQYHYNWSTKGLTAGLYRIYANLADGTQRSVDICLTK